MLRALLRLLWRSFLAVALLSLAGPAGAAALLVFTTTTDLKSLVETVGGPAVTVESLTSPLQDPHTAELKPAQLARLRQAALLVRVGLDHEPWLARVSLPAGVAVLDTSRSVRLLQTETPRLRVERRAHVHAFGNTHYWLDPVNGALMAQAITDELIRLRPADKAVFIANRDSFLKKLQQRLVYWQAMLAPFKGSKLVVMHDSWAYFAARFALQVVAAAEPVPGVPPSPVELAALAQQMRSAGVRVLVAAPDTSTNLVDYLVREGGAKAVTLYPSVGADKSTPDYISLLDTDVSRLTAALR